MIRLLAILLLLPIICNAQKGVHGLGTLPFDTGVVARHFRVDSTIKVKSLSSADTQLLATTSNGTFIKYSRSNIQVTLDTSRPNGKYASKYYVDSLNKLKSDRDSTITALKQLSINNLIYSVPAESSAPLLYLSTNGWDRKIKEKGNVIWNEHLQLYVMLYNGYIPPYADTNSYLGVATSPDGKTWTKRGVNGDGLLSTRAGEDPYITMRGDSMYVYCEDKADNPFRNIRLFTSIDAVNWQDRGDVLDIGGVGSWESQDVSSPTIWNNGDTIWLFYEGRAYGQSGAIGLAWSIDMYNFTKYAGNPIITGTNLTDSTVKWAEHIVPDDIIPVGKKLYMLAHAYSRSVDKFLPASLYCNISDITDWVDILGTWRFQPRNYFNGGTVYWNGTEYVLTVPDSSQTKIVQQYWHPFTNGDFRDKDITTDQNLQTKYLKIKNANSYTTTITNVNTTSSRNDTLPNKSGVIALTSDIPSLSGYLQWSDTNNNIATDYDVSSLSARVDAKIPYSDTSASYFATRNYLTLNYAPITGGTGYIRNTTSQQTADYNISGNGVLDGKITCDTIGGSTSSGASLQLTSTYHATKGKIYLGNASVFDEVNNRIGINTTSPTARLESVGVIRSTTYGGGGAFQGLGYGGTSSSPTATPSGQELVYLGGVAYTDAATITSRLARISIFASQAITTTNQGTGIDFVTVPNNSTSASTRGRIDQDGAWLIGTTTNDAINKLQVTGSASITGSLSIGNHLNMTAGSNTSMNTATLSGGTVTVSNTSVTAGSKIFVTAQTCSNCGSYYIGTITVGTSFVINSTNGSDASTVAYLIIN